MINIAEREAELPKVFKYECPAIPSAGIYYFTSDAGVRYEVRFGRKQLDILSANIVFGVLNDEYQGEEYSLTHKGEFYSVIATVDAIIQDFKANNPHVRKFEFSGEPRNSDEQNDRPTTRTLVYLKFAKRIFPTAEWRHELEGNKVSIERI